MSSTLMSIWILSPHPVAVVHPSLYAVQALSCAVLTIHDSTSQDDQQQWQATPYPRATRLRHCVTAVMKTHVN